MLRTQQAVHDIHHTRCQNGSVVLYYRDPRQGDGAPAQQSEPVKSVKRSRSATIDQSGQGNLARYVISTQATDYELSMPVARAEHLEMELRFPRLVGGQAAT
jgi:hypothetical protein